MHMTMWLERKRPKILKKEQILQRKSPPLQDTVDAQKISIGIIRKVTWKWEETQLFNNMLHPVHVILYAVKEGCNLIPLVFYYY